MVSETLYPGESSASQNFKLVRLARACREVWITEPHRGLQIQGYIPKSAEMSSVAEKTARSELTARISKVREDLGSLGVDSSKVSVDSYYYSAANGGQIWIRIPIDLSVTPKLKSDTLPELYAPSGTPPVNKDSLPEMSAGVIIDPKSKLDKNQAGATRLVETQVTVSFKKPAILPGVIIQEVSVSVAVSANGFEEAGIDAVIRELKLTTSLFSGYVTDVKLKLKLSAGVEWERTFADKDRALVEFGTKLYAKVKSSLSIKLKSPIPGQKPIEVEAFSYLDAGGKVGWGVQITVFEF